jgi:hypothetical protein
VKETQLLPLTSRLRFIHDRDLATVSCAEPHQLLLARAGDPGFAGGGEHVDLAADSELGMADWPADRCRVRREAGVGQDLALVVGFEVVEVRAGAVQFGGDVVAGAVGEVLAEAGLADDFAGGVVGS